MRIEPVLHDGCAKACLRCSTVCCERMSRGAQSTTKRVAQPRRHTKIQLLIDNRRPTKWKLVEVKLMCLHGWLPDSSLLKVMSCVKVADGVKISNEIEEIEISSALELDYLPYGDHRQLMDLKPVLLRFPSISSDRAPPIRLKTSLRGRPSHRR
ncbi:hypothetical protein BV25DRAFT_1233400 [Artomyces pyxidatus]|uniref:Uncharacterized protein n=1 Tax=Artomyces pyxidatus TaxID=48021 RepID=A0ACB8SRD2_9AGAM|nr:hypothetical protein BV25DRAFT_1233400 [Artomyces pyxidatus]